MSKQQLEELASQLGLEVGGTLDDLRRRVKEKWSVIEPFLPSASMTAKFTPGTEPEFQATDSLTMEGSYVRKMKLKLLADMVKNVPFLTDTDPERVLKFLIAAKEVHDLKLVGDSEFIALLISRTTGRMTSILGSHLNSTQNWGMVRAEIVNTFLPTRVRERHLALYVLDRFQSPSEDLNTYITTVVAAAEILGFEGGESRLVHRILQNLHPRVKTHLMFSAKPESLKDLYGLATTVAEGVAIERQREMLAAASRQGQISRIGASSMVVAESSPANASNRVKCWACGELGHLRRDCLRNRRSGGPEVSGNAIGAQEYRTDSERQD
jgi:hypothetical protein